MCKCGINRDVCLKSKYWAIKEIAEMGECSWKTYLGGNAHRADDFVDFERYCG